MLAKLLQLLPLSFCHDMFLHSGQDIQVGQKNFQICYHGVFRQASEVATPFLKLLTPRPQAYRALFGNYGISKYL